MRWLSIFNKGRHPLYDFSRLRTNKPAVSDYTTTLEKTIHAGPKRGPSISTPLKNQRLLAVIPKIENGNVSGMYPIKQRAVLMPDTPLDIDAKAGQRIQSWLMVGFPPHKPCTTVILFGNSSMHRDP